MSTEEIIFWVLAGIIFYTYVGYGLLLFVLVNIKRMLGRKHPQTIPVVEEPAVTIFITAYNERSVVKDKMMNTLALDYPSDKLRILWVTDGSTDGTPDLVRACGGSLVYHEPERRGKIAAMNRGMKFVTTPIVIFSDANTLLGKNSIRRIVQKFLDPRTGCVSGEKRIAMQESETASGSGEGLYWKYESMLKKWDAELYSAIGAAGELFAVRTSLYEEVEPDTLLDDFMISLRVAQRGYIIQYDAEAYAIESASVNMKEELKRKIRIAAGGIQSVMRLLPLLNIFRYGWLSFQYISHRVMRWTITPLCLALLLLINVHLASETGLFTMSIYPALLWMQLFFYVAAFLGWMLENRSTRIKLLFVPYYFFIMNLCMYLGFLRFIRNRQSVTWEKSMRSTGLGHNGLITDAVSLGLKSAPVMQDSR
jgi:cellulose synthase/poly-beta-1,6-N-acetylglucosamine synthase-like glycosyltransferase